VHRLKPTEQPVPHSTA